jgi:HEAT repeat protein
MLHALESLRDESWQVRRRAAELLGQFGDVQVIAMLGETLADPNEGVRNRAAEALGKIGGEKAYETLIGAFEGGNVQACLSAMSGLTHYPHPGVIKRLAVLLGHIDWSIREHAADSLVRIGEAATPWLAEVLEKGIDAITDRQADLTRLLEQIRSAYSDRYQQAHQPFYESENDIRVRSILRVLGRIGGTLDDPSERNRYFTLIAPYAHVEQYDYRAFQAVANVAAPASLDLLADFVRGGYTSQTVRAARAMGRLGKMAMPFMLYIVLNGTRSEVATIHHAFATLPPDARLSFMNRLLPLSKGKRYQVARASILMDREGWRGPFDVVRSRYYERPIRHVAIDLIGTPGFAHQRQDIQTLSNVALQDHDVSTRRRAVEKLGEIWPYAFDASARDLAENTLATLASSDDVGLRRAAVRALAIPPWPESMTPWQRRTSANIRETLLNAFEDNDMIVRGNAILALGSRGVNESAPRLMRILQSHERELHHATVQALAGMDYSDEITLALMDAAAPSQTAATRRHAIRALGRQSAQKAVPMLLGTLTDPSHRLRKEAAGALHKTAHFIGEADIDSVNALHNALGHPSELVRCHAARALALAHDAAGKTILLDALDRSPCIPCLTRQEIEEALERIA